MTESIVLCIVGAGSSYTPELIEGILRLPREQLPVTSIGMTDVDPRRLAIMAELARRMIRHAQRDISIRSHTQLEPMVEGADFVVTQIRVGGMAARYLDESIPVKYGILGQETTGPGGMFKALRTIPPMLEIARTVERVAPKAFILNYTNPSGIVAEAVRRHTRARIIGLCAGIPNIQVRLKPRLQAKFPDLKMYCVGLNHLGFIHRIVSRNRDVTGEAIDFLLAEDRRTSIENADAASMRLAQALGAIPIGYAMYYFNRGRMLRKVQAATETRAQQVMKIEKQIMDEAAAEATVRKPETLQRRGGGGYAQITLDYLTAIRRNSGEELVANVPNRGCVEDIEADAVVEVVCRADANGATPLPVGPIPIAFRGVVQAVKAYETLTVAAAVQQSKRLALQALLNHPLCGDLDVCEPLLDEMLQAHRLPFG